MKLAKTLSLVCVTAALAFAGCKKTDKAAGDKPAAGDKMAGDKPAGDKPAAGGAVVASDDDYVAKASAMMDKMVDVVKGAGTNCDKLADDLTKMAADNGEALKALTTYEKAHPEAKKKFDDASKDKMKAFEEAATPAMTACKDNKKVGDAFEKLSGM